MTTIAGRTEAHDPQAVLHYQTGRDDHDPFRGLRPPAIRTT